MEGEDGDGRRLTASCIDGDEAGGGIEICDIKPKISIL